MSDRAYDKIRRIVEKLHGTMTFERKGYRYGAWIIRIGGREAVVEATGERSLPELDRLFVPKRTNPKHWDDYSKNLVPDAESLLMRLLR